MSSPTKRKAGRLLAELHTYLEQRRESGLQWYLDAGPVGGRWPSSAGITAHRAAEEDTPADGQVNPEAVPSALSVEVEAEPSGRTGSKAMPSTPEANAGKKGQVPFEQVCALFVKETLAKIDQTRQTVTQAEIFTAAAAPQRLDSDEKATALAELAEEVRPCTSCKLHEGRTQTVFGQGDANADLVFVGEAPGRDEDLQGEPFVGRAGKLLTEILGAIKLHRQDVYICNILKCRPPGNRDPERDEVDACEPHLKRQLEIIEPKIICCLGRHAAQTLLNTRASLGALRESVHFYEGVPVMVTFHPAALLRNPHWKHPTWDDVRKLKALHDALRDAH